MIVVAFVIYISRFLYFLKYFLDSRITLFLFIFVISLFLLKFNCYSFRPLYLLSFSYPISFGFIIVFFFPFLYSVLILFRSDCVCPPLPPSFTLFNVPSSTSLLNLMALMAPLLSLSGQEGLWSSRMLGRKMTYQCN